MSTLRIEDDSDQLKVPADEIPPVRPADVAAVVDAATSNPAARLLGTSTTTTAPAANAPRQIPGLAFRAAQAPARSSSPSAASKKDTP